MPYTLITYVCFIVRQQTKQVSVNNRKRSFSYLPDALTFHIIPPQAITPNRNMRKVKKTILGAILNAKGNTVVREL
jgi:hypothetical protein